MDQKKIIKRLKEVNQVICNVDKPYRLQLLDSDMPSCYQSTALKKNKCTLNYMDPGSGEYYKIKQWVDTFMSIPFGKTRTTYHLPWKMELKNAILLWKHAKETIR